MNGLAECKMEQLIVKYSLSLTETMTLARSGRYLLTSNEYPIPNPLVAGLMTRSTISCIDVFFVRWLMQEEWKMISLIC